MVAEVRDLAGIAFPGTTYPEVNRLAQATLPDSVTVLDNGDIDVPGLGTVRRGFTRTDRGVFAFGRILVAGDAAHQFPATGIGINFGMLDAVNVAWKLAADIRGWAPAGLLDTYHDERHFAGGRGLMQTQAQVALRRRPSGHPRGRPRVEGSRRDLHRRDRSSTSR